MGRDAYLVLRDIDMSPVTRYLDSDDDSEDAGDSNLIPAKDKYLSNEPELTNHLASIKRYASGDFRYSKRIQTNE